MEILIEFCGMLLLFHGLLFFMVTLYFLMNSNFKMSELIGFVRTTISATMVYIGLTLLGVL